MQLIFQDKMEKEYEKGKEKHILNVGYECQMLKAAFNKRKI